MSYKTFEIVDGKLLLNNENSHVTEPRDIDIYLDSDNFDNLEYMEEPEFLEAFYAD